MATEHPSYPYCSAMTPETEACNCIISDHDTWRETGRRFLGLVCLWSQSQTHVVLAYMVHEGRLAASMFLVSGLYVDFVGVSPDVVQYLLKK